MEDVVGKLIEDVVDQGHACGAVGQERFAGGGALLKSPEDVPPPRDELHAGPFGNVALKGLGGLGGFGLVKRSYHKAGRAFGKQAAANTCPNKAPSAKNKNGFSGNIHADFL